MPLSPPPLDRRPQARTAALQPISQPPSSVLPRYQLSSARMHRRYLERYQEWQDWARRFARTNGVVRFAGGIKSDACARCLLRVEERDPSSGEWGPTEDPRLGPMLFDAYRNEMEEPTELVRAHAWHYSIAGELAQVVMDGPGGTSWSIYSMRAIERDKPKRGLTRVKLTPNGNEKDGTAFVVPSDQVVRMWIPDEEWKAFATSPMAASIEPLQRYHSLTRTVKRIADSRLVQNNALWTPEIAHESDGEELSEAEPGAGAAQARSQFQKDFYEVARRVFEDDDDILSVAPYLMWWGQAGDEPKSIEIGSKLDSEGIAHRKEALEDFARGIDIPSSIVVGGGSGDSNHWSEWLVDKRYFGSAIAPTMDRITHNDLTVTYLRPVVRFYRLPEDRFRIGYDEGPVVVEPDQSDLALRLHLAGLLGDEATLEAANFDLSQIMKPDELGRLLEVLARGREYTAAGGAGTGIAVTTPPAPADAPVNAGNVTKAAPAEPTRAMMAAAAPPGLTTANRLLRQLTALRQRAGRQLLDGAEVAFADAMRRAGVKLATRAKARKQTEPAARAAALAAVDAGGPLAPHLAAVGVTEAELLDRSFDSYQQQAQRWLRQSVQQQRAAIRDAGLDPDAFVPDDPGAREAAAAFATAALVAIARRRLTEGPQDLSVGVGEISGDVPATIIVRALDVALGQATAVHGETPDHLPQAVDAGRPPIEQAIVTELVSDGAPIEWTWEWGFYGDPVRPFEPHQDLGLSGFTTTDRDADPALAVTDTFPETDTYQPQDHDGCTCTWVPSVNETLGVEFGPGTRPIEFPNPGTTALEAAGVR